MKKIIATAVALGALAIPATAGAWLPEWQAENAHQARMNARCGDAAGWTCQNRYLEPAHTIQRIGPDRVRVTGVIGEQGFPNIWDYRRNRMTLDWGICTDGRVCLVSVINGY